jgi:glycosyltransferase involved in cell wall biosynthesis
MAEVSRGLVVSYSPLLGGAERILLDLAPALGRAALACPPGPLADAVVEAGLESRELRPRRLELRRSARDRLGAPLRIAAQARELRRLLGDSGPDWVVAWNMRAAMSASLARGRGGPPLLFQHNDFLPAGPAARAVRAAARRAEIISALSRAVARDLDPEGRLGDRLVVSHPGVDLERFPRHPLPADGRDVLVLGAVVPWKRPELALEVAARVTTARLLIAGAPLGPQDEALLGRLRERAARPDIAGRVEFLGALDDPRPALRRAALLLHCADREPFGLALVEALACGRPVVAPAAGGPVEILDESCGRLYPPGDADAAARAVAELLDDRDGLERLSDGARRRAERNFDLVESRRRFSELLERLSAGGAIASR